MHRLTRLLPAPAPTLQKSSRQYRKEVTHTATARLAHGRHMACHTSQSQAWYNTDIHTAIGKAQPLQPATACLEPISSSLPLLFLWLA